jgi:prepilin peptidase CpaA
MSAADRSLAYLGSAGAMTLLAFVGGSVTPPVVLIAVVAAATDLAVRRVFNVLTLPAIVAALAWHVGEAGPGAIGAWASGLVAGFLPMLLLFLLGGLGGGDVKLAAALGAFLGWEATLQVLFVAVVVGAGWAAWLVASRGQIRRTLGNLKTIVLSLVLPHCRPVAAESLGSTAIPFGVALAVATLVVVSGVLPADWLALPAGGPR